MIIENPKKGRQIRVQQMEGYIILSAVDPIEGHLISLIDQEKTSLVPTTLTSFGFGTDILEKLVAISRETYDAESGKYYVQSHSPTSFPRWT